MKTSPILLLTFFIFLTCTNSVNAQSPWITKKSGYSHISIGAIPTYSKVFQGNLNELEDLNGDITEFSIQSYTEYGVTDKIGVLAEVPLRYISSTVKDPYITDRKCGNILGLGNIGLGMKYNLIDKKILVTAQTTLNLPTNFSNTELGLRTGYNGISVIPTISVGKGTEKSFYYVYSGFYFYGDDLSNNFVYGIEYGYHLHKKLWTILTLNGKESFYNGDKIYPQHYEETYQYINNQLYTSLSVKLIYELNEHIGLNGSTNIISVRANNLPFQRPFSLGFYYKW